jgi:hypothetical protein
MIKVAYRISAIRLIYLPSEYPEIFFVHYYYKERSTR